MLWDPPPPTTPRPAWPWSLSIALAAVVVLVVAGPVRALMQAYGGQDGPCEITAPSTDRTIDDAAYKEANLTLLHSLPLPGSIVGGITSTPYRQCPDGQGKIVGYVSGVSVTAATDWPQKCAAIVQLEAAMRATGWTVAALGTRNPTDGTFGRVDWFARHRQQVTVSLTSSLDHYNVDVDHDAVTPASSASSTFPCVF